MKVARDLSAQPLQPLALVVSLPVPGHRKPPIPCHVRHVPPAGSGLMSERALRLHVRPVRTEPVRLPVGETGYGHEHHRQDQR